MHTDPDFLSIYFLLTLNSNIEINYVVIQFNTWENIFCEVRIILLITQLIGLKVLSNIKVKPNMKTIQYYTRQFPSQHLHFLLTQVLYSSSCLRLFSVHLHVFWGLTLKNILLMTKNHQWHFREAQSCKSNWSQDKSYQPE